jgi:PII-like signaling protein
MRALPEQSWRLRVYCGESDRHGRMPLHEAVVRAAHDAGLAGATVLRGSMGFGAANRIHTARVLRLAEELPVIVELIDDRAHIDAFLPTLRTLATRGLVTLEPVEVVVQSPPAER